MSASSGNTGTYGRGAKVLSAGIATTGVVTFAYFSLAAHALSEVEYKRISLVWSIMFVVASVIYRPIEQLLSRTIAEGRARGATSHPLRQALTIQASFALAFLAVALALRGPLRDDVFDGSSELYWILVAGVLFYAASYFARGYVAGHQQFALYGGLVFLEASSRVCFAIAAIVGVTSGQTAVALGMAAGPLVSLIVVPAVLRRRASTGGPRAEAQAGMTGFAVAVLVIMASEQTLINAAVLTVDATSDDPALAGVVFSVLLIARAPLQLFQAIQGSLLPHLASVGAGREFDRAIRITVLAMAAFAGAVALGLFAVGPTAMDVLFDIDHDLDRIGLAMVALGMGSHLVAGTLNQAALARGQAAAASRAWLIAAVAFLAWMIAPTLSDQLLRAEAGYFGATALLSAMLAGIYRRAPTAAAIAA